MSVKKTTIGRLLIMAVFLIIAWNNAHWSVALLLTFMSMRFELEDAVIRMKMGAL